jgi:hypothetical protein
MATGVVQQRNPMDALEFYAFDSSRFLNNKYHPAFSADLSIAKRRNLGDCSYFNYRDGRVGQYSDPYAQRLSQYGVQSPVYRFNPIALHHLYQLYRFSIIKKRKFSSCRIVVGKKIVKKQRDLFNQGHTRSTTYRIDQLKKLLNAVKSCEDAILAALKADLNKPAFEAYSTEVMQIVGELKYTLRHLNKWTAAQSVCTPMELQPGRSRIFSHPYGVVLNIAPWNDPVQICLLPLIAILAAGNCAVIKPSEFAPHSSELVARLIADVYPPEYCTVVEGGVEETQALLARKRDYIAFTGSLEISRIIARAAPKT